MPARVSADLTTGSGLRAEGSVPNGRALPGYYAINLSATQSFKSAWLRGVELRFDVLNLLDRRYEIRDGTGVGVGAPQFGLRRTLLAGFTQNFLGKMFFLKKEPKTFCMFGPGLWKGSAQTSKSFLLLFFKKEVLPF